MDDEVFPRESEEAPEPSPWASGAQAPDGPARGGGRRRRARLVASGAAVAVVAGGLGAGLASAFSGATTAASGSGGATVAGTVSAAGSPPVVKAASGSLSAAQIAKLVDPGVVDINTVVTSPSRSGREEAAGTGMLVTHSGEVLTNNHVVEDATSIRVTVAGHGSYLAKVVGVDPSADVAVLALVGVRSSLPTVTLADSSSVAVGASVVAIGNALGLGHQPTVVTGSVTATGRTITASGAGATSSSETLHGLIQTDASIVPGDSGGPLVNGAGQVIGMDTAASSSDLGGSTVGFAIPTNSAVAVVDRIVKGVAGNGVILGESPYLGVFQYATQSGGFGFNPFGSGPTGASGASGVTGVYVSDVAAGGPAARAGLAGGDTITSLDGTATPTITALKHVIASLTPGARVSLVYVDQTGTTHSTTVTIGAIPA